MASGANLAATYVSVESPKELFLANSVRDEILLQASSAPQSLFDKAIAFVEQDMNDAWQRLLDVLQCQADMS